MTFQCYGKSMRQKFLMLPQTITVDLSTKTKYHIDNMDKEIKMHTCTYHPFLGIFYLIVNLVWQILLCLNIFETINDLSGKCCDGGASGGGLFIVLFLINNQVFFPLNNYRDCSIAQTTIWDRGFPIRLPPL